MRTPGIIVCSVFLAGCASHPVASTSFSSDALGGAWADAVPPQPAPVEGSLEAAASPPAPQPQEGSSTFGDDRHVTFMVGGRKLTDDTADDLDVDDQFMLGAEVDVSNRETGNGFEVGTSYSNEDSSNAELTLWDLYGGYRKTFHLENDQLHPYFSVGAAIVHGELDLGPADDDDTTLGAYFRVGMNFELEKDMRLGVDFRHLFAELDFFSDDVDVDYNQLAIMLGIPF
jgi:Outer membrane protein beta-barrel domain